MHSSCVSIGVNSKCSLEGIGQSQSEFPTTNQVPLGLAWLGSSLRDPGIPCAVSNRSLLCGGYGAVSSRVHLVAACPDRILNFPVRGLQDRHKRIMIVHRQT